MQQPLRRAPTATRALPSTHPFAVMSSRVAALLLALVAIFAAPQHAAAAAQSCHTVCVDPGRPGVGPRVRARARMLCTRCRASYALRAFSDGTMRVASCAPATGLPPGVQHLRGLSATHACRDCRGARCARSGTRCIARIDERSELTVSAHIAGLWQLHQVADASTLRRATGTHAFCRYTRHCGALPARVAAPAWRAPPGLGSCDRRGAARAMCLPLWWLSRAVGAVAGAVLGRRVAALRREGADAGGAPRACAAAAACIARHPRARRWRCAARATLPRDALGGVAAATRSKSAPYREHAAAAPRASCSRSSRTCCATAARR